MANHPYKKHSFDQGWNKKETDMKTKIFSSTFFIFIFLLTSCRQEATSPVIQTPTVTQLPTEIPTMTLQPTFTLQPFISFPSPTAITPYATASVVKGNAVAFISENSLWIVNVDGSGERKLVDIEKNTERVIHYSLKWSPDGKWISYISGADLWIISPDSLAKKKIISVRDNKIKQILKYEWSPDGSKIAYAQVTNENPSIMIVRLLDLATGKISEISSSPTPRTITLSWTPDGSRILLSEDTSFLLFDINMGEFIETKTKEVSQEDNQCSAWWYDQLFWSPNGQRFALSWHGGGAYYSQYLCMHNLDGAADYGIKVDDDIYAMPPAWDKTGDYLYLVARNFDDPLHVEINPDLRLVRFDIKTQKVERLLSLTDDTFPSDLFWDVSISPDGRTIELHGVTEENQLSFIIMDVQSLSTNRFVFDFDNRISIQKSFYSHNFWTADNQNIVLCINGYFYAYTAKTGKAIIFSGEHFVESWAISPIATTP